MVEHDYHGPKDHRDDADPMRAETCQACQLSFCKVCRGGECELPEECPGRVMTAEERQMVCDGDLEFFLGCWWHKGEIVWTDKLGTKVAYR